MVFLTVSTPADFRLQATIESHGWYQLAPYTYNRETGVLSRRLRIADDVLDIHITDAKMPVIHVEIGSAKVLTSRQRFAISQAVRNMLNLKVNLRLFYQQMQRTDGYAWVDDHKAGRLLASPTVWEDLVKTLMTTNISWSGTQEMARKIVALDPDNTFPTPEQIMSFSQDDLTAKTGMGYRGAYLYALAKRITSGEVNVESWRSLDSDSLYKAVTDLTGFGDYAAGTMLRLLGHFDKLAIDTVARNAYEQVVGSKPDSDTDIRQHYEQYGEWRGLVLWMDCIRENYLQPEAQ